MKKRLLWVLTLALLALFPYQNILADYCTYSGNMTNGNRKLNSFSLTDETNTVSVSSIQTSTSDAVYKDKTSSVLITSPGATLRFSALDWTGDWMHGYVFIDYDKDGTFNQTLNADGTTGGELVSYNYYNGSNSLGVTTSDGAKPSTSTMPSWTLPTELKVGTYRLRFKIDWNDINPCGRSSATGATTNLTSANGGVLVDITIKIPAAQRTITVTSNYAAAGTVTGGGTQSGDINITATPNSGYEFVNWTLNGSVVSTSATYTDTTNGDKTYVANFAKTLNRSGWSATASTQYSSTSDGDGPASYAIDGNSERWWHSIYGVTPIPTVPHWIQFDLGSEQTFDAFNYVSRTGGTNNCNGNVKTYSLYVSNTKISDNIDASYVPTSSANATTIISGGTFTYNGDKNHKIELDQVYSGRYVYMLITDTYNTSSDAKFGNCDEFYLYQYNFDVTISAQAGEGGSVQINGEDVSSATISSGASVTLTASANDGYAFVNWTNSADQVVSTDATYTFNATTADTYTANFAEEITITIESNDDAMGTVRFSDSAESTKEVGRGASVTIIATPASHEYKFVQWEDGSQSAERTIENITETATYTATFAPKTIYTVTVNTPTIAEGGSVTYTVNGEPSGGTIYEGDALVFTASVNDGYRFVEWSDGTNQLSTNTEYATTATANMTIIPVYEEIPTYAVNITIPDAEQGSITLNGEAAVESTSLYEGTSVSLQATAAYGYRFVKWLINGGEQGDNPFTLQSIAADMAVSAVFEEMTAEEIYTNLCKPTFNGAGNTTFVSAATMTLGGETTTFELGDKATKGQQGAFYADAYPGARFNLDLTYTLNWGDLSIYQIVKGEASTIYGPFEGSWVNNGSTSAVLTEITNAGVAVNGTTATYPITIPQDVKIGDIVIVRAVTGGTSACQVGINEGGYLDFVFNIGNVKYLMTANATAGGTATAAPVTAEEGSSVTFTATPSTGYEFVNWTDAEAIVSEDAEFTVQNVASDLTYTANFQLIAEWEPTVEALATAEALIAKSGVGYPATTTDAYINLQSAIAAANEATTIEQLAALESAIAAYKIETNITMPINGGVYSFIVGHATEKAYIYNNDGTLAVATYTEGVTVLPESASFICEESDGKYLFKTSDNKYMAYPTYNTGIEASVSDYTKFNVIRIVNGTNVSPATEDLFGLVYLQGKRVVSGNDQDAAVVVKFKNNGTLLDTPAFDPSSAPFANDNYSSAISIVEMDLTLSATASPAAGGTASVDVNEVEAGGEATFTATLNEGYRFDGWYNGEARVSTELIYNATNIRTTQNLVAKFVKVWNVNVSSSNETIGTVAVSGANGEGTYDDASNITVTANPIAGYKLASWTKNGVGAGSENPLTVTVTEDLTIVADFEAKEQKSVTITTADEQGTLELTINGQPADLGTAIYEDDVITLTASAKTGYSFVRWEVNGEVAGTDATYTTTVTENMTITPVYDAVPVEINLFDTSKATLVTNGDNSVNKAQSIPPYRIPGIAKTKSGRLIAVAARLVCGTDPGYGEVDVVCRTSDNNGVDWTDEVIIADGTGEESNARNIFESAYGDPAIVADRTSNEVAVFVVAGCTVYNSATRSNPNMIGVVRSTDNGENWEAPEDITNNIYSLFDGVSQIEAAFIAGGKVFQSRIVKKGDYYRLYAAINARPNGNRVVYSDDFGRTWQALGGASAQPVPSGDEPKCEELPDGRVIISSRMSGGRYYNIYTYTNTTTGEGSWGSVATSNFSASGKTPGNNSTNGEILVVPVVRNNDGKEMYLALQSLPTGSSRTNVGIFYKELTDFADYNTVANLATGWDGYYEVTTVESAYSSIDLQADNKIAFIYEKNYYPISVTNSGGGVKNPVSTNFTDGSGKHNYDGYDNVYVSYSLEYITNKAYSVKPSVNRGTIVREYLTTLISQSSVSDDVKEELNAIVASMGNEPTSYQVDAIYSKLNADKWGGKTVTFTNVQQDDTQFVIYVNESGELALSTSTAEQLGASAQFECTKQANGKYTFYNEAKGVYMIWRAGSSQNYGYNSNKGTLSQYDATYCDLSFVDANSTKANTYYMVGARNTSTQEGTFVAIKATAQFDSWDNSLAWSTTYSNLYYVNVLPTAERTITVNAKVGETELPSAATFTINGSAATTLTASGAITIVATPSTGYEFVSWTDENGEVVSTSTTLIDDIKGSKTYTANLERSIIPSRTIRVAVLPSSSNAVITINDEERTEITAEGEITITATPASGYDFVNWTDENDQVISTELTIVDNTDGDKLYTANLMKQPQTWTVTVTSNNPLGGTATIQGALNNGKFSDNSEATLIATPAVGYKFVQWVMVDENDKEWTITTQSTYTTIIKKDENYIAQFEKTYIEMSLWYIMGTDYTPSEEQSNRYLKSVTAEAGDIQTVVFDATNEQGLPRVDAEKSAFAANTDYDPTATTTGALIDKTANSIKVLKGTESMSLNFKAWTSPMSVRGMTAECELDQTQQAIYIDWNDDKDFMDDGENYGIVEDVYPNPQYVAVEGYTREITIPQGIEEGTYRMRVVYFDPTTTGYEWAGTIVSEGLNEDEEAYRVINQGRAYDFRIRVVENENFITFDAPGNTYFNVGETAEITITYPEEGAKIYYTTDGSTPNILDAEIVSGGTLALNTYQEGEIVVSAIAVVDGVESDVYKAKYYVVAATSNVQLPSVQQDANASTIIAAEIRNGNGVENGEIENEFYQGQQVVLDAIPVTANATFDLDVTVKMKYYGVTVWRIDVADIPMRGMLLSSNVGSNAVDMDSYKANLVEQQNRRISQGYSPDFQYVQDGDNVKFTFNVEMNKNELEGFESVIYRVIVTDSVSFDNTKIYYNSDYGHGEYVDFVFTVAPQEEEVKFYGTAGNPVAVSVTAPEECYVSVGGVSANLGAGETFNVETPMNAAGEFTIQAVGGGLASVDIEALDYETEIMLPQSDLIKSVTLKSDADNNAATVSAASDMSHGVQVVVEKEIYTSKHQNGVTPTYFNFLSMPFAFNTANIKYWDGDSWEPATAETHIRILTYNCEKRAQGLYNDTWDRVSKGNSIDIAANQGFVIVGSNAIGNEAAGYKMKLQFSSAPEAYTQSGSIKSVTANEYGDGNSIDINVNWNIMGSPYLTGVNQPQNKSVYTHDGYSYVYNVPADATDIKPYQAFMLQAAETIAFEPIASVSALSLTKATESVYVKAYISVDESSPAKIILSDESSENFVLNEDAWYMAPTSNSVSSNYFIVDGKEVGVTVQPDATELPMTVYAGAGTNHTISLTRIDGEATIYLKDAVTDEVVCLNDEDYNFTATAKTTIADRFTISMAEPTGIAEITNAGGEIKAVVSGDNIKLYGTEKGERVALYNSNGMVIAIAEAEEGVTTIETSVTGVIIIKVADETVKVVK